MANSTAPPDFLVSILGRYSAAPSPDRPHVTLTFAQSLDAKIAGQNGKQLILSGKDSMIMTHWMRTMHDAILVGIGTALNDDPQLNTRHLPPRPDGAPHHLPRPIILDSQLRLSPTCKLLTNHQNGRGRRPWLVCALPETNSATDANPERAEWQQRLETLRRAGARVIQVHTDDANRLPIPAVLAVLQDLGVRSIMVEGGARIIASFFAESAVSGRAVIDSIIVTVAPTFVGGDGIGYDVKLGKVQGFEHVATEIMGKDAVLAMTAIETRLETPLP